MNIVTHDNNIIIRSMEETEQDLWQYLKWMTDPETMRYWDGMTVHFTYEKVLEKHRKRIAEGVTPCIIEYCGESIGYCQFYELDAEEFGEEFARFVRPEEKGMGIDIFLGAVDKRDQGIGTSVMKLLTRGLFEQYDADVLMIDPKIHNLRAIRCYEKAGFRKWFVIPQHEEQDGILHDSQIMGMRKSEQA